MFVLEYSEPQLPETTITLSVAGDPLLNGGPCAISSTHDRAWITPYGPLVPTAGAWWDCVGWATTYDASSFASAFYGSWPVYLGTATDCSSNADIYCFGSSVADSQCVSAPVSGCGYAGSECCRHCDVPGKNRCSFRDEPYADYHPTSSSLPRPSLTFDHLRCVHPLRYTGTVSYASWSCEVNVTGCCGGELSARSTGGVDSGGAAFLRGGAQISVRLDRISETSPHLASSRLISPHLASSRLISPHLASSRHLQVLLDRGVNVLVLDGCSKLVSHEARDLAPHLARPPEISSRPRSPPNISARRPSTPMTTRRPAPRSRPFCF